MTYPPTMPPNLPNNLGDIITKVRLITKSPSQNMITDEQIVQYVNTYYLYDFPQELRLENSLSNWTFTTVPYQEKYKLPTDTYISIEPPFYVNGYQSFFSQSQDSFYRLYPPISIQDTPAYGNGTTGPYTFTLSNSPVYQNRVVIGTTDASGASVYANDFPLTISTGVFTGSGIDLLAANSINYITGAVTINFTNPILASEAINVQLVPYVPSRPTAMLFFNDEAILRPVPDGSYQVRVQAYVNPFACVDGASYNPPTDGGVTDTNTDIPPVGFNDDTNTPQIQQWWQLIAWGAAIKVLEDRGDWQIVQEIYPFYDKQLRLALRRTLVQMSTERSSTIYTEQTQNIGGSFFGPF